MKNMYNKLMVSSDDCTITMILFPRKITYEYFFFENQDVSKIL